MIDKRYFFLLMSICIVLTVKGQSDLASWTSVQLNYKVDAKSTISLKPIIRHNNNLTKFQDQFVDAVISHKLDDKWTFGLLNRWITDYSNNHGYAVFTDVAYSTKIAANLNVVNRLRYHLGFDFDLFTNDFLRYEPRIVFGGFEKYKLYAAADFFYSTDSSKGLALTRYQLGTSYKISNTFKLSIDYWYEAIKLSQDRNVIILSLGINLH
jgi:hypothetical protein